jgi:hypothetical protein
MAKLDEAIGSSSNLLMMLEIPCSGERVKTARNETSTYTK